MLRNPVKMLPSYHAQMVYYGDEDILNFEKALAAEDRRRNGKLKIKPGLRFDERLFYREVISYSTQIKRYLSLFNRDHIFIIIYGDFKADTSGVIMMHETFGMPIIEAMACGCPVVTSSHAGCVETAGGAALIVDPYSVDAISGAMRQLTNDAELRRTLRERGLERAKRFTWRKCAEEHLTDFERTANNYRNQDNAVPCREVVHCTSGRANPVRW